MDTLIDLTTRDEFLAGLMTGGIGAVAILLLAHVWKRRPLPIWGITAVAAAWLAVWLTVGRRLSFALGLIVLAGAGWLWDRSKPFSISMAIAGAAIVVWRGGLSEIMWIRIGAVVAILLIGVAIARFDTIESLRDLTVPLLAITFFGIWATVPDTETARIPLGVLVLMGIVAWPWRLSAIGSPGGFAIAGLIVWIAAVGGEAREGSIIGAWTSVGLLLAGLALSSSLRSKPALVLLLHGVVVFMTSRVAGFQQSAIVALLIATPAIVIGVLALDRLSGGTLSKGSVGSG